MATQENSFNRNSTEEIIAKIRDPETTEDEQIAILADILLEAFLWQQDQQQEEKETASPPI